MPVPLPIWFKSRQRFADKMKARVDILVIIGLLNQEQMFHLHSALDHQVTTMPWQFEGAKLAQDKENAWENARILMAVQFNNTLTAFGIPQPAADILRLWAEQETKRPEPTKLLDKIEDFRYTRAGRVANTLSTVFLTVSLIGGGFAGLRYLKQVPFGARVILVTHAIAALLLIVSFRNPR